MSANGRLASKELSHVQGALRLAKSTAQRYQLLKAAAKRKLGRSISIALPEGGYRSFAVQDAMRNASLGSNAAKKRHWGLSTSSSVPLAAPGHSSHGTGTRVDIVGTPIDEAFLHLAAHYGFRREFGPADPNHFRDYGTYKLSVVAKIRAAVTPKTVVVTVQHGDTLSAIAAAHRSTLAAVLQLNPSIKNPDRILVGQKVRVA